MKREGLVAGLSVLFALLLVSCQPAAKETNVAPNPNTNSARESVDKASIEAALLRIEKDWSPIPKEKDAEAARRVEAEDVVLVFPDGTVGDKTEDVKDIERGALTAESMEMMDLEVHVLSGDAAVVSGRTIVKNGKYKLPDGKSIDISGQYRFVDTFARRNGEWKVVASASVPIRLPAPPPSPVASPAAKASPALKPSPASTP